MNDANRPGGFTRALIAGWFSFELMGATAGDIMSCEVVQDWLRSAGCPHDVAFAPPFEGGVRWQDVDPGDYSHVIFVCGPLGDGPPSNEFFERFSHCHLTGLNLSMLQPLDEWNPFDLLWERDSSALTRPDLSLLSPRKSLPIVGVLKVHKQNRPNAMHEIADAAIDRLLQRADVVGLPIDTRLDMPNRGGLRNSDEIEAVIARMDAVVTTRLHGMVLALKNGVPAVVIDPIAGGDKVLRQALALGWPAIVVDELTDDGLANALSYALSDEAHQDALIVADRAVARLPEVREQFVASFRDLSTRATAWQR